MTPPEHLHLPAPRTQYASEYGHLLRIASLHARLEASLGTADSKHIFTSYAHVCSHVHPQFAAHKTQHRQS